MGEGNGWGMVMGGGGRGRVTEHDNWVSGSFMPYLIIGFGERT